MWYLQKSLQRKTTVGLKWRATRNGKSLSACQFFLYLSASLSVPLSFCIYNCSLKKMKEMPWFLFSATAGTIKLIRQLFGWILESRSPKKFDCAVYCENSYLGLWQNVPFSPCQIWSEIKFQWMCKDNV